MPQATSIKEFLNAPKNYTTIEVSNYNRIEEEYNSLIHTFSGILPYIEVRALAKTLKKNQTITSINLWGNYIGDKGAKALAKMLKENQTITSVNLSYNEIGDEGAKALAEMLKVNETITSIILFGNRIGEEGGKALAEVLKENQTRTLIFLEGNPYGDKILKDISEELKINKVISQEDEDISIELHQVLESYSKKLGNIKGNNIQLAEAEVKINEEKYIITQAPEQISKWYSNYVPSSIIKILANISFIEKFTNCLTIVAIELTNDCPSYFPNINNYKICDWIVNNIPEYTQESQILISGDRSALTDNICYIQIE